ncbi:MAG: class I SAM-dependent methyltransferase [Burkholderiales bacterium]|nr:class I SAM-dependent methyltransferase [Burkholderiales bacterium]
MNVEELKTYRCPKCKAGSLELLASAQAGEGDGPAQGTIKCPGCGANYSVRNGVPRFVPDDQYAESFGFQWNKFRRTQLDSHTGMPLTANRLFHVTQWPRDMRGVRILEAGSGAGRFSEVLLGTGATLFSFDLSSAVDANMASNGKAANLNLFQASIYDIPLPEQHFDKVMCLGVLQHTPDPERSFASLARYVKPGGELAVDVYSTRWRSLMSWKYLLRPITKRIPQQTLFGWVENAVNVLLPVSVFLRKIGGKFGARLIPIVEYSNLGLPYELNREWAILDTFDMYSPSHDHPRSIPQVRQWFAAAKFVDVVVEYGPNGVIGRGRRPTNPGAPAQGLLSGGR